MNTEQGSNQHQRLWGWQVKCEKNKEASIKTVLREAGAQSWQVLPALVKGSNFHDEKQLFNIRCYVIYTRVIVEVNADIA